MKLKDIKSIKMNPKGLKRSDQLVKPDIEILAKLPNNVGFINYEDFKYSCNLRQTFEFDNIINEIAKEYAKDNEKYFECDKCDDCVDEHDVVECPECNREFQIYEGL